MDIGWTSRHIVDIQDRWTGKEVGVVQMSFQTGGK